VLFRSSKPRLHLCSTHDLFRFHPCRDSSPSLHFPVFLSPLMYLALMRTSTTTQPRSIASLRLRCPDRGSPRKNTVSSSSPGHRLRDAQSSGRVETERQYGRHDGVRLRGTARHARGVRARPPQVPTATALPAQTRPVQVLDYNPSIRTRGSEPI
jgi:hypothetical protein